MSIDNSSDDELPLEKVTTSSVADDEAASFRFDDWEMPSNVEPCAVYPEGPQTLGRVTTPMGDLRIANLFGAPVPMMRKLGRRSTAEIREGALPFVQQFTTDIVDTVLPGLVAGIGRRVANQWLKDKLYAALPATYLKMLRAFAEASGHDVDGVIAAQLAWDVWGLCVHSSSSNVRSAIHEVRRHSPLFGSASTVLPTAHCGPLHLRWLDNAALGRWDRKASIVFLHPDRGLPYALVSSLGFLTGLPAGMNAAGLSVSVEPGGPSSIDWTGSPLGWPIHEILRQAHTIEEAASILRQHPPMVSWRYVICEGDTGRAAIFEAGQSIEQWEPHLRPPFALTTGDVIRPEDRFHRVRRWHERRRQRLDRIVQGWDHSGDDAVYRALEAMTDPDSNGPTGSGHPLSGLSNVSSVVFEPANRRLWVAAGRAPVARRWFVPLCLRHANGQGTGGGLDGRVRPLSIAGTWEKSKEGRAVDHLRHAYQLELEDEDDERILITVEHALALDSTRPAHHVLAGLLAIRLGRNRRAEGALRRALKLIDEPSRKTEISVYLAWALDRQRRRREARQLYRSIARNPAVQRKVRQWARRGKRRRFRRRDLRKMHIDFFLATVYFD